MDRSVVSSRTAFEVLVAVAMKTWICACAIA
jgi:hypothetical protein